MHCRDYLRTTAHISLSVDAVVVEAMVNEIARIRRDKARLYIVGLGGSAANAIHMAADLRKLCEVDAEAMDNIAELTARANDEGWPTIFSGWLQNIGTKDCLFVLSVGGGTDTVSKPLVAAIDHAKARGASIMGIVGPVGGYTAKHGNLVLRIPAATHITPHTEAFQAVVWHCMVSHPVLQLRATTW